LFGTGATADEADFDFKSLGAKKALRDYKKAVAKDEKAQAQKQKELDEAGAKAAKKTRDAFAESLKKALKKSMQAGNLEEANKINAAIKALKKGASPAGGSAANRKAQKEANRPTVVAYWPNGQKNYEYHYKDGEPDGPWTHWYENGQKQWEAQYKDGKQNGLTTWWYPNGKKESEAYYKDGEIVSRKKF
jgi:antitoxin component YwqK of YwqJK toxin-antitoxin module